MDGCSTEEMQCKGAWILYFVVPKDISEHNTPFSLVINGVNVTVVKSKAGYFTGTGACYSISTRGCSPVGDGVPSVSYEYHINRERELTELTLAYNLGSDVNYRKVYNLKPISNKLLKL